MSKLSMEDSFEQYFVYTVQGDFSIGDESTSYPDRNELECHEKEVYSSFDSNFAPPLCESDSITDALQIDEISYDADSVTLTADRAVVDTQSPISLLPGTVVTVNGKKCVLDVSHGTGKLVAYPIKSEAKRPRGRPRKVAKLEDSRESVAAETATSVSTIDDSSGDSRQVHSDWETAAAQILLGMSEVDGKRRSTRRKKQSSTLQEYEMGAPDGIEEEMETGERDGGDTFKLGTARTKLSSATSLQSITSNRVSNLLSNDNPPGLKRRRGRPRQSLVIDEAQSSHGQDKTDQTSTTLEENSQLIDVNTTFASTHEFVFSHGFDGNTPLLLPLLSSGGVDVPLEDGVMNSELLFSVPALIGGIIVQSESGIDSFPLSNDETQQEQHLLYVNAAEEISSQPECQATENIGDSAGPDHSASVETDGQPTMLLVENCLVTTTQCSTVDDGAADVPASVQQITSDTQTTVTVSCAPIVMAKTGPVTLGVQPLDEEELGRLKCPRCDFQALYAQQYQDHLAIHSDVIRCKCCAYIMTSEDQVLPHMKEFHPRCVCTVCGFMTSHAYMLTRHKMIHSPELCKCEHCGKTYKDMYILKSHIKQVHMAADVLFECAACGKKFNRRSHLNRHAKSHGLVKRFQCPYCDYSANEKSDVTKHAVIHNEPQFSCELCQKTFYSMKNKKLHFKRHIGQRDYKCGVCDYFAYTFTDIRKHIERKHASVKRYICDYCQTIFKSELTLQVHRSTCAQLAAAQQQQQQGTGTVFLSDTNSLLDTTSSIAGHMTHVALIGSVSLVMKDAGDAVSENMQSESGETSSLVDMASAGMLMSAGDYVLSLNTSELSTSDNTATVTLANV